MGCGPRLRTALVEGSKGKAGLELANDCNFALIALNFACEMQDFA